MEDRKAVKILEEILKKYPLTTEEKQAILNAIGILAWTKLIESKRDARQKKQSKNLDNK